MAPKSDIVETAPDSSFDLPEPKSHQAMEVPSPRSDEQVGKPLRILFLSSDTGGGHRASAEALAAQFLVQFPGSQYELVDLWTDHGVLPYRTLVNSYKHLSTHPNQWRTFYHLSDNKLNKATSNNHANIMCGRRMRKRIDSFKPDLVVCVHPTMNSVPLWQVRKLSKKQGKDIPFFTVVTDMGSGHIMWFDKGVDKVYLASDRLRKKALRAGIPEENIVMTGLPIRSGFAAEAEKLGDRTTESGKGFQMEVRRELGISTDKKMILVMGGGEGVGSLSDITDALYAQLTQQGVDATICVVCGRNEKIKADLAIRDWEAVIEQSTEQRQREPLGKKKGRVKKASMLLNPSIKEAIERAETTEQTKSEKHEEGNVDVVALGFITNMPQYMVAADVLVSKAGPGTIAEASSVGLPIMLTSFLPGQEAGNVEMVLEDGYGDYCETPSEIARQVGYWLQDSDLLRTMSRAAREAGNLYAAGEIVSHIGAETKALMKAPGN